MESPTLDMARPILSCGRSPQKAVEMIADLGTEVELVAQCYGRSRSICGRPKFLWRRRHKKLRQTVSGDADMLDPAVAECVAVCLVGQTCKAYYRKVF